MNSVSWLIYAGGVVDNLRTTIGIGLVGTCIVCVFSPLGFMVSDKSPDDWVTWIKRFLSKAIVPVFVGAAVLVVAPGRDALMLIAASEIGETVLASKDAQTIGGEAGALATDSLKLLRKYVTEQLAGADAK